jgi:hypothetical protein
MTTQLFKANTRAADFGWLSQFSFSLASVCNSENCVLNDVGQTGFWNPRSCQYGDYYHTTRRRFDAQRQYGNEGVIRFGVQVMSAGSGVEHSEMNASATDHAKHCNYGFS